MYAYSESKSEYAAARKFLSVVLTVVSVFVISIALMGLFQDAKNFLSPATIREYSVPPLLTVSYLPILFAVSLYSRYERLYIFVGHKVENTALRRRAMIEILQAFNYKGELIDRWQSYVSAMDQLTLDQMKLSTTKVLQLKRTEANPGIVDDRFGWSPYIAKHFLDAKGVIMGYYSPGYPEWYAHSNKISVAKSFIDPTIEYSIEGSECIATSLTIAANSFDQDSIDDIKRAIREYGEILSVRAIRESLPEEICFSISNFENYQKMFRHFAIRFEYEKWGVNAKGFDAHLIIEINEKYREQDG